VLHNEGTFGQTHVVNRSATHTNEQILAVMDGIFLSPYHHQTVWTNYDSILKHPWCITFSTRLCSTLYTETSLVCNIQYSFVFYTLCWSIPGVQHSVLVCVLHSILNTSLVCNIQYSFLFYTLYWNIPGVQHSVLVCVLHSTLKHPWCVTFSTRFCSTLYTKTSLVCNTEYSSVLLLFLGDPFLQCLILIQGRL
jgi:hypothetical protein